jgi:hypothetical protein
MNKQTIQQTPPKPTQHEIEEMLVQIRPVPGDTFHTKMQKAAWRQASKGKLISIINETFLPTIRPARQAIFISAILLLLVLGYIASPTLKAAAKQFISFFVPAQTDTLSLPITIGQDGNLVAYDAPDYFSADIYTLPEFVEFDLLVIPETLFGLKYSGTNYNLATSSVTTMYKGTDKTIYFTQRPTKSMLEFSSVGASAPIEMVIINGEPGEFVVGGWRPVESQLVITPDQVIEINENIDIFWDPNQPQRIMRWEENDLTYELLAIGQGLSKSFLLDLAESMTPIPTR